MEYQNPEKYENYWKTRISELRRNEIYLRGYPLEEISGRVSYTDAIILLLRGELPGKIESEVINAIFTSAMDHQFLNATAYAARVVVSANPDPVVGIATGILSFGKVTAGVPGHVVSMLNKYYPSDGPESYGKAAKRLVDEYRSRGERIWGFGHPLHDMIGPHFTFRSQLLRDRIEEAGLPTDGKVGFYEAVHTEFLQRLGGKRLPINVDGVMGAAFAELGYDPLDAFALAPFTMLPGIVAHVVEEIREGSPLRIVPESEYIGPAPRSRFGEDVAQYRSDQKLKSASTTEGS
jgi:citrate synthase